MTRHGQPRSHHLGAAAQHKRAGPAGPDILQAGQVFAQEAIEIGAGLALRGPEGCGNGADAQHGCQGQHDKGAHPQAYPPVHVIEQPEHTYHQDAVAEHIDHKPREEAGQSGHVTVHPLDQLTRRMGRVERGIQPQQVGDKVGAQRVRGRPAHVFGHVGFGDSQTLARQSQAYGQAAPGRSDRAEPQPEVAWSMKRLATSGVTTCTPMVPHRITASRPIRGHSGRR